MAPEPEQPPMLPYGARPDYFRESRFKSPVVAALLSLMPGLGQVYLGYTRLGFLHGGAAATFVALLSIGQLGVLDPALGVFMVFFWLYNLVDAHRRAILLNEAAARMTAPEPPGDFGGLSLSARLGLGIALVLGGLLAFLRLHFGLSFEWLGRWWPLGLVGCGLYLILRAWRDRAAGSADPRH